MAQKNKCYAIIGDNGYGLSPDWSEITSYFKVLQKEMHHGFQKEEEAYEWLEEQSFARYRISACGLCDLPTLLSRRLVIIDDDQHAKRITNSRKPAESKQVHSISELNQFKDGSKSKKKRSKNERKKALLKDIEKLLDEYLAED